MDRSQHNAAVREGLLASMHSWELVTAVDGPGTRLTVFLSGCPLRCLYCHNPDTMFMRKGQPVLLADLVARMARYQSVFRATGGGLTVSGGEPLMQSAFVERLLEAARQRGIHTAIDTSGFLGAKASDTLLGNLNLVLLDVKSGSEETYRAVTGRALAPTVAFGDRLAAAAIPVWVRFVLVPGLTDGEENIRSVARIAARWPNVERVEVLPFHQMGRDKWESMGLPYELTDTQPPSAAALTSAREIFRNAGLTVH